MRAFICNNACLAAGNLELAGENDDRGSRKVVLQFQLRLSCIFQAVLI